MGDFCLGSANAWYDHRFLYHYVPPPPFFFSFLCMDILYVASFASSTWLYRREVSDEWTWKAGWQLSALKQCRDFYMVLVWAGGNQPVPCWGWLEDGARCWTDKISRAEYCQDFYKKYGVFKYMNGWGAWKWGFGHGKNPVFSNPVFGSSWFVSVSWKQNYEDRRWQSICHLPEGTR